MIKKQLVMLKKHAFGGQRVDSKYNVEIRYHGKGSKLAMYFVGGVERAVSNKKNEIVIGYFGERIYFLPTEADGYAVSESGKNTKVAKINLKYAPDAFRGIAGNYILQYDGKEGLYFIDLEEVKND